MESDQLDLIPVGETHHGHDILATDCHNLPGNAFERFDYILSILLSVGIISHLRGNPFKLALEVEQV